MTKKIEVLFFGILIFGVVGCSTQQSRERELQSRVQELEQSQFAQAEEIRGLKMRLQVRGALKAKSASEIYQMALDSLKVQDVSSLQRASAELFENYRSSPLTSNALFLLGRAFFERGDYQLAAIQFQNLYRQFPDGNKAVGALYHLGMSLERLGRGEEAGEAFHRLMTLYPGSREAKWAEQRVKNNMGTTN